MTHELEGPPLDRQRRFFPYGFAVDVHTNCCTVLEILDELWGYFPERFEQKPIRCEIFVTPTTDTTCPPEPRYHLRPPFCTTTCDRDNFSIVDIERGTVFTQVTQAALRHRLFAGYFLLPTAVACICTRYVTPVHGACVSWKGRGILLCGDSGAGKSTLAYACALNGWSYTTDDASLLLHQERGQLVIGNSNKVRLRPESAAFFPEIANLEITPRATGKPSIELPTRSIEEFTPAPVAEVRYVVYLNRKHAGPARLVPFPKEKAKASMAQSLWGMPDMLQAQYQALDRLLQVPVFELRYQTLDEAQQLLRRLAEAETDVTN
jgi:hypothetical protein